MITQKVVIPNATAKQVFDVLMDSRLHSKVTGDKAVIDPVEGGFYSTFSGYADGRTLKLIDGKFIEQTWRADDWDFDHYSTVIFKLKDKKDGAEIEFTQEDIPVGRDAEYKAGWMDNYWAPMKKYFKYS